jgi:hypothetical protein
MAIEKQNLYSCLWASCDAWRGGMVERYATLIPRLTDEVETLARRVEEHLKKMGIRWS